MLKEGKVATDFRGWARIYTDKEEKVFTIEFIRKKIAPVMKMHQVNKAVLFGSFARGTNDDRSDLDIMVIMDTAKRFLDRVADFEDLYDTFPGMAIDLLVYNSQELDSIAHRPFIKKIMAEGVMIYEP